MATHELPDWEGASAAAPKHSIFRKPLPTSPFSRPKSLLGHDHSSLQAFDKETAVESFSASASGTVPVAAAPSSNRKYFGLRPRIWIIIAVVTVVLLALIIGLAVGLHHKSSESQAQDLPLPTNKGIFTGDLTYYSPGPGYGACGYQNTSTEAICAVSHIIWDEASTSADPNDNPLCGKHIRINRFDASVGANRSVDVEVVDRCVGCKADDLDLSLAMFTSLADQSLGRVVGSWAWLT